MYSRSRFVKISGAVIIMALLILGAHSGRNVQASVQQATTVASPTTGATTNATGTATTAATGTATTAATGTATTAATGTATVTATSVPPSGPTTIPGTPVATATATRRAAGAATLTFVPCTPSSTAAATMAATTSVAVSGAVTSTPMGTATMAATAPTPKPGFIGFVAQQVDDCGARITILDPNSPAGRAGLRLGDVVVAFDDQPIFSLDALRDMLSQHQAGDRVRLTFQRGTRQETVTVVLGDGMAF